MSPADEIIRILAREVCSKTPRDFFREEWKKRQAEDEEYRIRVLGHFPTEEQMDEKKHPDETVESPDEVADRVYEKETPAAEVRIEEPITGPPLTDAEHRYFPGIPPYLVKALDFLDKNGFTDAVDHLTASLRTEIKYQDYHDRLLEVGRQTRADLASIARTADSCIELLALEDDDEGTARSLLRVLGLMARNFGGELFDRFKAL